MLSYHCTRAPRTVADSQTTVLSCCSTIGAYLHPRARWASITRTALLLASARNRDVIVCHVECVEDNIRTRIIYFKLDTAIRTARLVNCVIIAIENRNGG